VSASKSCREQLTTAYGSCQENGPIVVSFPGSRACDAASAKLMLAHK